MILVQDGHAAIWVCGICDVGTDLSGVSPQTRCFVCGRTAKRWFLKPGEVPKYVGTHGMLADTPSERQPNIDDPSWPPALDPS